MINFLLRIPSIRKKVLHRIKYNYFNELNISIPLKNNYWADLMQTDSYDSFSEIFIHNEYEGFVPDIEIKSLIDLGAHHGFFSVWLQSIMGNKKLNSLLIEPSARCFPILTQLLQKEDFKKHFVFLNKCIGNPNNKERAFYDRPHMASSNFKKDEDETPEKVKVLTETDITRWQRPPYDLLKCDIEGAEFLLLKYYSEVLLNTKFVIIEWHNQKSVNSLRYEFKNLNFSIIKESFLTQFVEIGETKSGLILAQNNNIFMNE